MKPKKPTKTIDQNILTPNPWILEDLKTLAIKDKIESGAIPLKDWKDVKIWYGIKTGYNKAFIIDTKTKDEILKRCFDDSERERTSKVIKPILKGRDIKRYRFKWNDLYMIFIPWHFPLHKENETGASQKAEERFQRDYHALYNYLLAYKSRLSTRNTAETGIRYEWYALQRCANSYYDELEKEKIVWAEIVQRPSFILADNSYYPEATTFIMTGNDLKYLIAFFNSDVVFTLFTTFYMGGGLGEKGKRYKKAYFEQLPIPRLNPNIPSEKEIYDRLCELAVEMMELHRIDKNEIGGGGIKENTVKEKKLHEQVADRIYEIDGEINRIIYKLYKLTDDEIEIIEDRL